MTKKGLQHRVLTPAQMLDNALASGALKGPHFSDAVLQLERLTGDKKRCLTLWRVAVQRAWVKSDVLLAGIREIERLEQGRDALPVESKTEGRQGVTTITNPAAVRALAALGVKPGDPISPPRPPLRESQPDPKPASEPKPEPKSEPKANGFYAPKPEPIPPTEPPQRKKRNTWNEMSESDKIYFRTWPRSLWDVEEPTEPIEAIRGGYIDHMGVFHPPVVKKKET